MKVAKYGPTCSSQGREFLPLGFTLWGKMSSGTHEFLGKVANAAHDSCHEHGYVGEVWGALKGDRNPGDATASSKASAASVNKNPCSWPLSPGTRGCHWQGSSRPRE